MRIRRAFQMMHLHLAFWIGHRTHAQTRTVDDVGNGCSMAAAI